MTTITSDTLLLSTDRHARVTAGPGAGKTHWLVEHTRNVLCRSNKLHSHARIAVITYTNVAADELRKRLGTDATRTDVGTIHSFLYHTIIRPYLHLIKKDDGQPLVNIQLMDGHDEHHVNHQKMEEWLGIINYRTVMRDTEQTDKLKDALASIRWTQADNLANWNVAIRPPDWLWRQLWKPTKERLTSDNLLAYKSLYWNDGLLDHDDVLYFANRILAEHPTIAAFLSARYPFLFIDEFQDTVPAQTTIVQKLADQGTTIVVIGDAEQSIFAFAGAQPAHFRTFTLPGMDNYTIEDNRRSTERIITLLNHVRRDGLSQRCLRQEQGEPVALLVGHTHQSAQHAKSLLAEGSSLLILGRYDTIVRQAHEPADTPHPWEKIEEADPKRKIFLEHLLAGLVLAREQRFDIANKTVLKGIRHKSDNTLKEPLRSNSPRPDLHQRAIAVVLLQTLVHLGPALDTMTLRDAYNACSTALTQQLGELSLTTIRTGRFATIADQYTCEELLRTVKLRNAEEVRASRTIHKAKGAEAKNVLVCLHGKDGEDTQARLNHLLHPAPESDEEHRVTYVGLSRTQDRLFLATPSLLPEEETVLQTLGLTIVRLTAPAENVTPASQRAARSRSRALAQTQRPLATTE
jgi:DNA helicase-2/ATP-dependent DNA helicase PcrA